jgi:hypothetical protein
MPLMRRANEASEGEWRPIPVAMWRFRINPAPEIKYFEQWNSQRARFPLILTTNEQTRLLEEYGQPPEGTQQSTRTTYMTGLSLGYPDRKTGQYKSTKLTDFLAACLGQANQKRFFDWIADGGGPPKIPNPDDQQAELDAITRWLGWFEDLEVLGSIRHEEDAQGTIWARFGGPLAVGSIPGQREDQYQAIGLGKLRSMIAEYEASAGIVRSTPTRPTPIAAARQPVAAAQAADRVDQQVRQVARATKTYEEVFGDEPGAKQDDIPF